MSVLDSPVFIVVAAFALFAGILASLLRLTHAGILAGRRVDGSVSVEAIAHSIVKLVIVLVVTVALSRAFLAPDWPGGAFAPDLSMAVASGVNLVASVPAVAFVALLMKSNAKRRGPAFIGAIFATLAASGVGQAITSGVAAGRDLTALLGPIPIVIVLACGAFCCAGVWLHAGLVRRIERQPANIRLSLADAALSSITTVAAVWLSSLAYLPLSLV